VYSIHLNSLEYSQTMPASLPQTHIGWRPLMDYRAGRPYTLQRSPNPPLQSNWSGSNRTLGYAMVVF